MKPSILPLLMLGLASSLPAQEFGVICTTDSPNATGPNNSHKLASPVEMVGSPGGDTMTLVFQSSQAIHTCLGHYEGFIPVWDRPVSLYPGQNPGICYGADSCRHIVWQFPDTSSGAWETYYRNLEYRMMPLNVSRTNGQSMHPDAWADSICHVVWEEWSYDQPRILYQTCDERGLIGDRVLVSNDDTTVACEFPSIERFGGTISVLWQAHDPGSPTPYSIRRRRLTGGGWQPVETLAIQTRVLRHPSQDLGFGYDVFSAAWEDSASFNLEAHFEGGNPGAGYYTPGRSMRPVISTLSDIWAYAYWEEDSSGHEDICFHHFYHFQGWYGRGTIRNWFLINEPVRAPATIGDLVVWTQGEGPEYRVMWALGGYPIPVRTGRLDPVARVFEVSPNPGRGPVVFGFECAGQQEVEVVDAAGRVIWRWSGTTGQVRWEPSASGAYVARVRSNGRQETVGLVRY